ncbi:RDD family protein [Helicobacter sp. 11S02596-1]|uniref:RDD family protein n=1 Tax=Helicobacter sp. 11S02596-1 TaxID=1476194 RepID=UPI000BA6BEE7|nr:RDD family protein [Helicobacter sp. 11S02596-1]PAF41411.1 hypothetical protein BJI48_08595 [Helicobacter sp. 11S02596-1]
MNINDEKIEEILFRENLNIPPFSHRVGAFLVDILLVGCLVWVLCDYFFLKKATTIEAKIFFIQKFIFFIFIFIFLYDFFFLYFLGASLGKIIFKMKIISILSLDKPSLKMALVRCFIKTLEIMACFLPFIFTIKDKFLRTFHDKLPKTIVISIE